MSVARESIIAALQEMMEFEEVAVNYLASVENYDFSIFSSDQQKQIKNLLNQLKEDSHEHEMEIQRIINQLSYEKNSA